MRGRRRRNMPSSSGSKKLECSRVYKRRRANKEEEHENEVVDIISNLPEHILHHIFSFVDMKQAIQTTCLLSRAWRYFWVSLTTLEFTFNNECSRKEIRNEFMAFVDRVFMLRSSNSNIDKFVLVTNYNIDVTNRLNTWILASVFRNVQEITLETHFSEDFHFHQRLLTCKTLTKLVVDASYSASINIPDSITLPRLKTLSLTGIKFEDEYSTNLLFSNFPVLESLTIHRCEFPHHINVDISSPLLQHLKLNYCRTRSNALDLGPVVTNFQLCAPNLISFDWCNGISTHCDSKNLSSVVTASISVYGDSMLLLLSEEKKTMYAPFMVNILRGLHNVEDLTLSTSFLEVVSAPALLESDTIYRNLRSLEMYGPLSGDCIHTIICLLQMSPAIETLVVRIIEINLNSPMIEESREVGLSSECLLNHLKRVEIKGAKGSVNELKFLETLLKNAVVLETLMIFLASAKVSVTDREKRVDKFWEKLGALPIASSSIAIRVIQM